MPNENGVASNGIPVAAASTMEKADKDGGKDEKTGVRDEGDSSSSKIASVGQTKN